TSCTVRTGSTARLTLNMSRRAPASRAARTCARHSSGVPPRRHSASREVAAAHHVRGDEGEDRADLAPRGVAILVAVQTGDLPSLDVVGVAPRYLRGVDDRRLRLAYVVAAEPIVDEHAVGCRARGAQ